MFLFAEAHGGLRIVEVEKPKVAKGEVLVKVENAEINS